MFLNKDINKKENPEIDLIIIGGGITGAGIALDAAQRGMHVVLFEKKDFASGTSSKSTKLIHGGLRYLKNLEFALVKEVGLERKIVHKNARHLVIAEKMLLPIVKKGSLNKFFTNIALLVYDFLAGVDNKERRKMLNKKETLKEEPLLLENEKNLIGGGLYYEYRTDDARLTIEAIKKAEELGAKCYNYSEVVELEYLKEKITGVKVKINEKIININAKCIVNASGPWVDLLRKKDKSLEGKRLMLSKGIHIVFDHNLLPIKHAIYFDTDDNRMMFAIPRNGKTYVGTTETIYNENINEAKALKEDVKIIIKAINKMFPSIKIKKTDIESSWAGLRPLIYEEGKSASELSRKDEVFISQSGFISIAGGKLTGYRKMAERTVDLIRLHLKAKGKKYGECKTEKCRLSGGDFDSAQDIKELIEKLYGEAKQIKINLEQIKKWVFRYGSNTPRLLEIAYNNYKKIKNNNEKLILLSELIYCIEYEKVKTISDFFIRRTSMLYFERNMIEKNIDFVNKELIRRLSLSKEKGEQQKEEFLKEFKEAIFFE